MVDRVETADFVVVIASPAYRAVGDGLGLADCHRGVQTEAALLRDRLHADRQLWTKRILRSCCPVFPDWLPVVAWPSTGSRSGRGDGTVTYAP
ncbi:hypothetical protein [Amycolatopsis sp. NPDC003861]